VDKKQIARILNEIGVLLELKGENPFKVRAYANSARIIEMLNEDIGQLVETGRIKQLKGIGKALADKITILVTTGDLPYYHELKSSLPEGLLEMLRIPGLGPKKIFSLYKTLCISGIAELEYACRENRLLGLKGFGQKSQDSILKGLEHIKKFQGRFLYEDVIGQAQDLLERLRECPQVEMIKIAGSLRRCKEIVKDIDLIASSLQPKEVMKYFTDLSRIAEVKAAGETKTSVMLQTGISADLRVVSSEEFPCALHHFTGSKEHNTAMRHRAKAMGIKINEYGLFKGLERMNVEDEAGIFTALGLAYIPPELREDRGEIEAAEKRALPDLIKAEDIQGAFHVHTDYSDGINTLDEMVAQARKAGFKYIGIADHSQTASYAGGLKVDEVKRQHEQIRTFNEKNSDFYVFHGIESDIHVDGRLDYAEEVLGLFDFIIASVHSAFSITGAQATQRLIKAMENPFTTMLAHPTGRLLLGRQGYEPDMEKVIKAAKANDVIIELNANPQRLDIDWRYLKFAVQQGVLISINPDAHRKEGLYDTFSGVGIARKGWLEKGDVFNTWPIEKIKRYLAKKRGLGL
jgi:DNA polymerase (family 10)